MSEEEKKAIETIKGLQIYYDYCLLDEEEIEENENINNSIDLIVNLVKKQQEELEKKDKIIDEMTKYIDFEEMDFNCSCLCVKEGCQEQCIKQYFQNKVEGSK